MFFLNPALLSVLIASIAPIIIHFIYRRRKEYIHFSSIYFIKEIEKKKRIKSSYLEYILLLLRILTIASLVFAFSKPISSLELPFSIKEKQAYLITVYLGRELDIRYKEADIKAAMIQAVQNFLDEDFRKNDELYYFDPEKEDLIKLKKRDLLANLSDLKSLPRFHFNAEKYQRIIEASQKEKGIKELDVHLFSPIKIEDKNAYFTPHFFLDKKEKINNNAILSAELVQESLIEESELNLAIQFQSELETNNELLLVVDNKTRYEKSLKKRSRIEIPMGSFKKGEHKAYLQLKNNDDYQRDNRFYFSFSIADEKRALIFYDTEESILKSLFSSSPDSSLEISLQNNTRLLRYSLDKYDYLLYEGNTPPKTAASKIKKYIEGKKGNFIFVPVEDFDYFSWNRSVLGTELSFSAIAGEKGNRQRSYLIKAHDFRSDLLSDLSLFNKKSKEDIRFHYAYRIAGKKNLTIIGNKQNKLLIQKKDRGIYSFLFPFKESASDFIYDARFVATLYALLHTRQASYELNLDEASLILYHEKRKNELFLESDQNYRLNLKSLKGNQLRYNLGSKIPAGNYQYMSKRGYNKYISINEEAIDLRKLSYAEAETREKERTSSSFYQWRFFILLAILFYLAELWLGRAR